MEKNRIIKFRGKIINSKEWVYGNLAIEHGKTYIFDTTNGYLEKVKEVIPETVGQYTGLKDKNGKEIYEGDIVYCQTKFGKAKAKIEFIDGKFVAFWNSAITHPKNGHCIAYYDINKRFEVIGNVYENKELLDN